MQSIVESAPVKRRGNPYRDSEGKFCKKSEAVYIVDSEGRLTKYNRHLPGKHDQSTHGKGGKAKPTASGESVKLNSQGEIRDFLTRNGIPPNQSQLTDKEEKLAAQGYASGGAGYINFGSGGGTSPGYQGINGYLRNPDAFKGGASEESIKEAIPKLDRAVSRHTLKEPVRVTRIVGIDAFGGSSFEDFETGEILNDLSFKPGDVLEDKAYLSTSMNSKFGMIEDKFRDAFPEKLPVKMNIDLPAGTSGLYLEPFNPNSNHSNASAQEFLLGRNTKMRVISAQEEEGVWNLNLTVLQ